ncbi:unnamed protein product [Xylocopa violacea]|uniref:Uncharacterized protein n=1 Tax=Xylocopa violacea TaxID=135666 RepID=A0ABP1P9E9_XYLVO
MTDALAQVQVTLAVTTQEPDRENLLSLQSDIQELITLTKESLHDVETSSEDLDDDDDADDDDVDNDDDDDDIDDPLAKEYALFKAELEKTSNDSESNEQDKQDDRSPPSTRFILALNSMLSCHLFFSGNDLMKEAKHFHRW